jgi:acyl CoA:acetate/3-ketoacid CoA transferase alpha subunit
MQVHFALTHNRAHAAVFELARQFRDTHSVDLVASGLLEYASVLVAAGAVRNTEGAFTGNTFPAPGPSRVLQSHLSGGGSHDPNWTNYTVTVRLMAGALGWPFAPTHSLIRSDLAHGPGRAILENPFGGGSVMLMAPIVPDVTFIHAAVSDTDGNAFIPDPNAESLWGAWAAKSVVVTAERIVSPAEFAALGPHVGLPGYKVRFVAEAPFGAHPQGLISPPSLGIKSYVEDYGMREELTRLSRDPAAMRSWVEEWVFAGGHDDYLRKLGSSRLDGLRVNRAPKSPRSLEEQPMSAAEGAATLATRVSVDAVIQEGYTALFAGIGLAHISTWAAQERCRAAGYRADLVAEIGLFGYRPAKGDPYLFNPANFASCLFHSGYIHMLGALAGPCAQRCLTVLGAAQIDCHGAVNSSRTADGRLLVGSGGASDLTHGASDYIVVMPAARGRLQAKVDFVTSPRGRLKALCTNLGVLKPSSAEGNLELAGVIAQDESGAREAVAQLRALCGWSLAVRNDLSLLPPPAPEEIELLRSFDPERTLLN